MTEKNKFNEFYFHMKDMFRQTEDLIYEIEGWCESTDISDFVATVDIKGNLTWYKDYEKVYADDPVFVQALERFRDANWFNDEELLSHITEAITSKDKEIYLNVTNAHEKYEYGIGHMDIFEKPYLVYGFYDSISDKTFIPITDDLDIHETANNIIKNIVNEVGATFCITSHYF